MTSEAPQGPEARGVEGNETTTRVLRSLRPLIGASSERDIGRVAREFANGLGAAHHAFGIVQRTPDGNVLRWLAEDARRWWEGFRPEFPPLIQSAGWPAGQLRACRRALDDGQASPSHDELRRLEAHSALFLVAEGLRPGDTVACLALLFGSADAAAGRYTRAQLADLGNHAASLLLDAYLRLPCQDRAPVPIRLSGREQECLRWASVGKTGGETAQILGLSERTVNFHLGNAFAKLKVNNKQAAVAQAILQGLL
ncbi:LuxR C-terminal-related transcriptional regulator [Pigmentiphaga sp. YJ18]|uniref:helix-turn-helix transcriptional regulator n=1 Tax=unclassified Pigmentiphaga TaxID=2626614 RepID=UPI001EDD35CE|nr:LuxR C-terminal-related transcriptional regulator [Pigmentiphaga sp. H8]